MNFSLRRFLFILIEHSKLSDMNYEQRTNKLPNLITFNFKTTLNYKLSTLNFIMRAFRLCRRAFRCIFARHVTVPPLIPSHNHRFRFRIKNPYRSSRRMPLQSLTRGGCFHKGRYPEHPRRY